jgi:RNA polymerase sigma-70 factor, ECF subfamily
MAVRPADAQLTPGADGEVLSDEQLLEGLRAGRTAAFSQLYRAHAVAIYNLCLRLLGSREDAQDVTQEVFTKACRQLPGCDADFRVRPWLYRVAVNGCYDQLRARRTRGVLEPLPDEVGSPRIDGIEQAALGKVLEQTLAGLSARHRTVMLLKDVHGLSNAEIASILGVSHGATETLVFRAHAAFRRGYIALVASEPLQACDVARHAVADSVGGELSSRQRRRLLAHAKHCPDCYDTIATWSLGLFRLGAFIRFAPLPATLARPPLAARIGGGPVKSVGMTAVRGGASCAARLGKAGQAAAGALKGGSAGATALHVGAAAKALIAAGVASALIVSGGATAHHVVNAGRHNAPGKVQSRVLERSQKAGAVGHGKVVGAASRTPRAATPEGKSSATKSRG